MSGWPGKWWRRKTHLELVELGRWESSEALGSHHLKKPRVANKFRAVDEAG